MSTSFEAFRERKDRVAATLGQLREVAAAVGAQSVPHHLERDVLRKLEEDRFHLVVVGEFNHGKTSFVNALLGASILPTGVTPTTATIHHLRYAAEPESHVVYTSGRREPLSFSDIARFSVGGGATNEEVDFLEVGYPAKLLEQRILLVDTPGVNDLSLQRADVTYSYIPRADAVLFLLDAGQILKESERIFLEEKLLKASRDKIVFVVTKWDLLSESERAEALAYAKHELGRIVRDPVVFPVSAQEALAGRKAESGMEALVAHLSAYLAEERGRILLDNALGEGLRLTHVVSKGIDARRRSLRMRGDELERRVALLERDLRGQAGTLEERRMRIREEVATIRTGARKDLERFVEDVIRQIPAVIDNAKGDELRKYLPAFLEETFRRWAEAESKEIAQALERLAEETIALMREESADALRRVTEALGGDVQKLEVKVDTLGYDMGVVALVTMGVGALFANALLGGLLLVAAPVFALVVRDKVDAEYRSRAKEAAPRVIRAAAEKVGPRLEGMIDDFGKKLDAWVVTAGEELHREVLEVLRSVQTARAAGAQDETAALAEVDAHAAELARVTQNIETLRGALWTSQEIRAEAAEGVPSV